MENIFARLGVAIGGAIVVKQGNNNIFSKSLNIENRGGKIIAQYGIIAAKQLKKLGVSQQVYYADINWNALTKLALSAKMQFKEASKFPTVSRDLALLLDKSVEFAQIEQIAKQTEKKFLKRVELFDVYEGKNLPQGKKSYAVNFILQDTEKTMNDKQIDAIMQKLIANLTKQLNAELR